MGFVGSCTCYYSNCSVSSAREPPPDSFDTETNRFVHFCQCLNSDWLIIQHKLAFNRCWLCFWLSHVLHVPINRLTYGQYSVYNDT